MDVSRENELDLRGPLLHGFRFRLRALVVLLEVIRKVPVQVEAPGVVPETTGNEFISHILFPTIRLFKIYLIQLLNVDHSFFVSLTSN